jgi:hypothetical protein
MTCQVEPLPNVTFISPSTKRGSVIGGKASSIRRRPVWGLTASQIALRPCEVSGSRCQ